MSQLWLNSELKNCLPIISFWHLSQSVSKNLTLGRSDFNLSSFWGHRDHDLYYVWIAKTISHFNFKEIFPVQQLFGRSKQKGEIIFRHEPPPTSTFTNFHSKDSFIFHSCYLDHFDKMIRMKVIKSTEIHLSAGLNKERVDCRRK